jgi:hypothetical protein
VGIGTSSPVVKLHVETNSAVETDIARFRVLNGANGVFLDICGDEPNRLITLDATGVAACAYVYRSGGTERMRLTSAGDLGIGTSSPAEALEISRTTDPKIRFVDVGNLDAKIGIVSSTALGFEVNGSERARITSGGDFGIGTTSPTNTAGFSRQLQISGTTAALTLTSSTGGSNYSLGAGSAGDFGLWNNTTSSYRWYVDSSGNFGIGSTNPSAYGKFTVFGTGYIGHFNATSGSAGIGFYENGTGRFYMKTLNGSDGFAFIDGDGTTEHVRIDASGNVGIAAGNAPTQVLSLYRTGSTNAIMSAGNSNTGLNGTWFGVDTAGNGLVNVRGAFPLLFSTNAIERMRIDTNGDVALGSSSVTRVGSDTTFYIQGTAFASLNLGCGGAYAGAGLTVNSEAALLFRNTGAERARITSAGHFRPAADNTYNLGEAAFRWANIYTADLNLSNRDSQNDVDGTWGEWTIQEGENDLYLINRRNGKKFKFMLKEVE